MRLIKIVARLVLTVFMTVLLVLPIFLLLALFSYTFFLPLIFAFCDAWNEAEHGGHFGEVFVTDLVQLLIMPFTESVKAAKLINRVVKEAVDNA